MVDSDQAGGDSQEEQASPCPRTTIEVMRYEAREAKTGWLEYFPSPDLKGYWLQRICFWVLRKLGACDYYKTLYYERITIVRDKLDELFHEVMDEIEMTWPSPKVSAVLIGPEELKRVMRETRDNAGEPIYAMLPGFMSLDVREWYGIPMYVVPWMKGILPITEDIFKYDRPSPTARV